MLHLAIKAYYPAKPSFPLLHVHTGWSFVSAYSAPRRKSRRE
jgi:sulfate adenylyltransferase subunit 2